MQTVPPSEQSIILVRQARTLAVLATAFMPALICVVALEIGYAPIVIAQALLLWALGTAPWLGYNWRLIKRQSAATAR